MKTTLVSFGCSAMLLTLFFSGDLVSWSYDLSASGFTDSLIGVLEAWDWYMHELGPAAVTEAIKEWLFARQSEVF